MLLRALRVSTACLVALGALACRRDDAPPRHPPPRADFLVAAGDSTFWVRSGPDGVRIRRSSILLTRFDGRFHEVYVTDDDHSYYDALLIGSRIYRRDLVSGDSTAVFVDPVVPGLARAYAAAHPGERPLAPDEDASDDPASVATSETDLLDLFGPYLTFEHHTDVDMADGAHRHESRRGVIDLRRGAPASLAAMFGDAGARRLLAEGHRAFAETLDSVRVARDARAARAAEALGGFTFDSASFVLAEQGGAPAVSFIVPGRGERAEGLLLPLRPVAAPAAGWWREVSSTLPRPTADSSRDEWAGRTYDVVARYDSGAERFTLLLRDRQRGEWELGELPGPARALYRLDEPPVDSTARAALVRAFDESALYSEEARTVAAPRRAGRLAVVVVAYGRPRAGELWPARPPVRCASRAF